MRPVTRYYESQNEYTLPLQGKPYYRNSGIIYAVDRIDSKYAVSRVDFERYDDQNFQYIFSPEWSVIDTLPPSIFQGIPGLDMSLAPPKSNGLGEAINIMHAHQLTATGAELNDSCAVSAARPEIVVLMEQTYI